MRGPAFQQPVQAPLGRVALRDAYSRWQHWQPRSRAALTQAELDLTRPMSRTVITHPYVKVDGQEFGLAAYKKGQHRCFLLHERWCPPGLLVAGEVVEVFKHTAPLEDVPGMSTQAVKVTWYTSAGPNQLYDPLICLPVVKSQPGGAAIRSWSHMFNCANILPMQVSMLPHPLRPSTRQVLVHKDWCFPTAAGHPFPPFKEALAA
jgi:hypothetical protein